MMNPTDPQLETARLILRPPRREDFDGFADLFANERAARYIGGHMPRAAAWRKFLQTPGAWRVQGFGMFSLIDKASGQWLGQLGPWQPEGWPGHEIGWMLRPAFWGRGYATEGASAAIDWAFAHLDWDDMIHCIAPDNVASQALARRLGSTNRSTGKLPAPFEDHPIEIWGQTRAEWMSRRPGGGA